MMNSVRGLIARKGPESVYIDSGPVEWELSMSVRSIGTLGPIGSEARIFVWLYHREDQMRLFGFANEAERVLFHDLMKVEGIGPRQAMRILSGISVEDFIAALEVEDIDRLVSVPGVGRKTAQKIILALKGKLARSADGSKSGGHDEIIDALAEMGFDRRKAQEAVGEAMLETKDDPAFADEDAREREIFKRTIVKLSEGPAR
jgi:Holliday junction DNA helicase RuvA